MLTFWSTQAVHLAHFIVKNLHVRDEEIQVVHLPIVFSALCEALQVGIFRYNGIFLTGVLVRFRSQALQREDPYRWYQTFCDYCMLLETKFLYLRSSNFLWMIHNQMPEARWILR